MPEPARPTPPCQATGPGTARCPPRPVSDQVVNIPNALSLLRLLLVPLFFWLVLARHDGWALAVLLVSGFTDYPTATSPAAGARCRGSGSCSTPSRTASTSRDAGRPGLARRRPVVARRRSIVGRDVLLAFTVPVLARHGYGPLPVHFLGKAATFSLLYAFPLLLLAEIDSPLATAARVLGLGVRVVGGRACTGGPGWLYVRQVRDVVRAG